MFRGRSRAKFSLSAGAAEHASGPLRVARASPGSAWPAARSLTLPNFFRLLLGIWIANLPFVYEPQQGLPAAVMWNHAVVGAAVTALAVMRMLFVREVFFFRIAHLVLGVWLTASPWLLDFVEVEPTFVMTLMGGTLISGLAAWSLVR